MYLEIFNNSALGGCKATGAIRMDAREREVILYLLDCPDAQFQTITAALGLALRQAKSILQRLENDGYVEHYPCGKGGSYSLSQKGIAVAKAMLGTQWRE